jgi:hypothetical protein
MIVQKSGRQLSRAVEKLSKVLRARFHLVGGGRAQNLHPVARRNDQTFAHHFTIHEPSQSFGARLIAEGEPLADLDRSGLVINSDEDYRHVVRRFLQNPKINPNW